jgi:predicted ribosomally synthesized peptide with SipW-like signal peptide
MKKKIFIVALVVCIMAISIASASMAYFTDTEKATNTFTSGEVAIKLTEQNANGLVFDSSNAALDDPVAFGNLYPGIDVVKKPVITNTGSEDAYVRVHIAIPTILDNGDPDFDASSNVLHFNMGKETYADGLWSWNNTVEGSNYPGTSGEWNFYTTTINDVAYNVYVVTFKSTLAAGEATCSAMKQVYLDPKVTNELIDNLKTTLGDNWHIYVAAEGVQAAGFANAYEALNTAFGVPGTEGYTVDWTAAAGVDITKGE